MLVTDFSKTKTILKGDQFMDITTALKTIQGYNVDILSEDKKVLGLLCDLIPDDKKTHRRIKNAYESVAIKVLRDNSVQDKNLLFKKASSCLGNYSDYDQTLCDEVIGYYFAAMGWQAYVGDSHSEIESKKKNTNDNSRPQTSLPTQLKSASQTRSPIQPTYTPTGTAPVSPTYGEVILVVSDSKNPLALANGTIYEFAVGNQKQELLAESNLVSKSLMLPIGRHDLSLTVYGYNDIAKAKPIHSAKSTITVSEGKNYIIANRPGITNSLTVKESKSFNVDNPKPIKRNSNASNAGKSKTLRKQRLFPIWLLLAGLIFSFIPFVLLFADRALGLKPATGPLSEDYAYYDFQMLIFKLSALIATLFLCITYVRKYIRTGMSGGMFGGIFSYLFTYNIISAILYYFVCPSVIGRMIFGSAESGPMVYNWIVYIYLFIVVLHDNYKIKKNMI